jgi:hypothetical protein
LTSEQNKVMHSNNTAKGNLKVFHRKRYCCQVLKTAETMMMSPNWRLVDDCIQQTQLAVPLEDTPNDAPGYVCAHEQRDSFLERDGWSAAVEFIWVSTSRQYDQAALL